MRADNLEQLFAFEEPIERAAVAVLAAADIRAFRSRDRAKTQTPCVHVKLWAGPTTGHKGQYAPGRFMDAAWHGHLVLTVYTNRADPEQAAPGAAAMGDDENPDHGADTHALLLGKVRGLMLYASERFTVTNLPLHYVQQIQDAGGRADVDRDDNVDATPLGYKLVFGIRGTAWPLPPAP